MRKLVLAAAAAASLALAGPGFMDRRWRRRRSSSSSATSWRPNTPKGKAAEKFKELAEKYTDGKVKVEVYPNSTLYKDKEELEALQLGAVQMLAPSNSKFGPIGVKEFEVFDLPYILPDLADLAQSDRRPARREAAQAARAEGHDRPRLLGQRLQGMSANKKLIAPVRLQGPEIPHPVVEGAGGAVPRARRDPAGDGVLAKSTRRCRPAWSTARRTPPSNIYTQKMHEVQKYLTADQPRLHRLCRGREQEVLGRPAGRHPRPARQGDEGGDRLRQRPVGEGKRRGARGDQEGRQDRDHHADAGAGRGDAQGDGCRSTRTSQAGSASP